MKEPPGPGTGRDYPVRVNGSDPFILTLVGLIGTLTLLLAVVPGSACSTPSSCIPARGCRIGYRVGVTKTARPGVWWVTQSRVNKSPPMPACRGPRPKIAAGA